MNKRSDKIEVGEVVGGVAVMAIIIAMLSMAPAVDAMVAAWWP